MGKWEDLSIRDKAGLIKIYVSGGVMDLSSMKRHYNSFAEGGDTDPYDEEIEDFILPTTRAARWLSPYSRKAIKAFAREDAAAGDTSTLVENPTLRKSKIYNRAWAKEANKIIEQERRKQLKRDAVKELQTGVPTGAFKEYTREGIDDAAPFAMGVVGASAAPWLLEGIPAVGNAAGKALDLWGKAAMPSALTKGVAHYIPGIAKEAALVGQLGDAAALAYWSAKGYENAKNAFANNDVIQGIGETALATLPFIPAAAGIAREGKKAIRAQRALKNKTIRRNRKGGTNDELYDDLGFNPEHVFENPTEEDMVDWTRDSEMRRATEEMDDSVFEPYVEDERFIEPPSVVSLDEHPQQPQNHRTSTTSTESGDVLGGFTITRDGDLIPIPAESGTMLETNSLAEAPTTAETITETNILDDVANRMLEGYTSQDDIYRGYRYLREHPDASDELRAAHRRASEDFVSQYIRDGRDPSQLDSTVTTSVDVDRIAENLFNSGEIDADNPTVKAFIDYWKDQVPKNPDLDYILNSRLFSSGADFSDVALDRLRAGYGKTTSKNESEAKEVVKKAAEKLGIDLDKSITQDELGELVKSVKRSRTTNNDKELLDVINNIDDIQQYLDDPSQLSSEAISHVRSIFSGLGRELSLRDVSEIKGIIDSAYRYEPPLIVGTPFDELRQSTIKDALLDRLRHLIPEGLNPDALLDPRHPDYREVAAYVRDNKYDQILPMDIHHMFWFQVGSPSKTISPKSDAPYDIIDAYLRSEREGIRATQGARSAALQSRLLQLGMPSETAIAELNTSPNSLRAQISGALANPKGYGIGKGQTTIEEVRNMSRSHGNAAQLNRIAFNSDDKLVSTGNIAEIDNLGLTRSDFDVVMPLTSRGITHLTDLSKEQIDVINKFIKAKNILSENDARQVNAVLKKANKANSALGLENIALAGNVPTPEINEATLSSVTPGSLEEYDMTCTINKVLGELADLVWQGNTAFTLERTPIITRKHKYGGLLTQRKRRR